MISNVDSCCRQQGFEDEVFDLMILLAISLKCNLVVRLINNCYLYIIPTTNRHYPLLVTGVAHTAAGRGAVADYRGPDRETVLTTFILKPRCESFTLEASRPSLHDNTLPSVSPSAPLSSAHCVALIRSVAQRFQSQQHDSVLTFLQAGCRNATTQRLTGTQLLLVNACYQPGLTVLS